MRELFIKKAIEFDDFYFPPAKNTKSEIIYNKFYFSSSNNIYTVFKDLISECNYSSMKEYVSKDLGDSNISLLTHFDIKKMREITLLNNNPFYFFYYLENELLFKLFEILAKTHQALKYYEVYSYLYRNLKEINRTSKKSKEKTLLNAIDIIKEFPNTVKLQEEISSLIKSFSINSHYTKRKLFENFLYEMHYFLIDLEYQNNNKLKKFTKSKIIEIVNLIIQLYFEEDIRFTISTKLEKFKTVKYFYDNQEGITLNHT